MSPSGLYLTWVSARSCPERRIGLMSAVCVGAEAVGRGVGVAFVVAVTLEAPALMSNCVDEIRWR